MAGPKYLTVLPLLLWASCHQGVWSEDLSTSDQSSQSDVANAVHVARDVRWFLQFLTDARFGKFLHSLQTGRARGEDSALVCSETDKDSPLKGCPSDPGREGLRDECVSDLARVFTADDNWAYVMRDSWARPGPSLMEEWFNMAGNYHQCRDVTAPSTQGQSRGQAFKGSYCVLMIQPKKTHSRVQFGTCVPDSCTEHRITDIMTQALKYTKSDSLTILETECRGHDRPFSATFAWSVVVLVVISSLVLLGTMYDLIIIQMPRWREKLSEPEQANGKEASNVLSSDPRGGAVSSVQSSDPPGGAVRTVLVAFSLYSNGAKLLDTSPRAGAVGCINGIRVLSMTWVVLLHTHLRAMLFGLNGMKDIEERSRRPVYDMIFNSFFFSVDTFFALSGFLVAYASCNEILNKKRSINWRRFYFHRVWRLSPPYMLYLLFFQGLSDYMGSGALWSNTQPLAKTECENNWWTNLLFLNNVVRAARHCLPQSWSMSNDMQFYILSPLLFLPLCYNKLKGLAVCLAALALHWLTVMVMTVHNDDKWPLAQWPDSNAASHHRLYCYCAPYTRCGPFIVGILTGYLLAANGGRVKLTKCTVVLGWVLSTTVCLALIFGVHGDVTNTSLSPLPVKVLYKTFASSAWGAAIGWVIIACVSGYGGPVNTFLSWAPFTVLARLCFTTYLTHYDFQAMYLQSLEQPFFVNASSLLSFQLSTMSFTALCAVPLTMALEMPFVGLEKLFFPTAASRHESKPKKLQ